MLRRFQACISFLLFLLCIDLDLAVAQTGTSIASSQSKVVLVHYMPWYEAKPTSKHWGWHWTMNHFQPDLLNDGKREIASKLYPLIGPYDSFDSNVITYHLLLMKIAGIDGVIIDWYGLSDFRDYPILHRNTSALIDAAEKAGLKFAICYEDQTIPALEQAGKLSKTDRVAHAARELRWMEEHWFSLKGYVRLDGKPVLLSFGHQGLNDAEWSECLDQFATPIAYFSEHHPRTASVGAFDWPIPQQGLLALEPFYRNAAAWKSFISVAYPRFVDVYQEAKLHDSYGVIQDDDGTTFRSTFLRAMEANAPIIQIATWNDWGEGTVIEPSLEYQYRDLELIQSLRGKVDAKRSQFRPADLQLPLRWYKLASGAATREAQSAVEAIPRLIFQSQLDEAKQTLIELEKQASR